MEILKELISPLELLPDVGTPERIKVSDNKLIIHPELVVMTDANGNIISRYKDDQWELMHAGTTGNLSFSTFDTQSKETMKRLILAILMHAHKSIKGLDGVKDQNNTASTRGLNSAKMAYRYSTQLKALYNRSKPSSRTLEALLNDKKALQDCISITPPSMARGLKQALEMVELVGESVNMNFKLDEEIETLLYQKEYEHQSNQHPAIPLPIYAELFRQRWAHFELTEPFIKPLCAFIKRFVTDPHYGRNTNILDNGKLKKCRTTPFEMAIKQHNLQKLFSKYHITNSGNDLKVFITGLHTTCAYLLNQLSGMRSNELLKLQHGCYLPATETRPPLLKGLTSKKHSGINRPQEWITHSDAGRIVTFLEQLSLALLKDINIDRPEQIPLFIKTQYLSPKQRTLPLHYSHDVKADLHIRELALDNSQGNLTLTQELVNTYLKKTELTPEYWDSQGYEQIGQMWKPTFHQGRRTFAFLAINSGMVTASVLKEQLAQSSMLMASYYGNGSSNLEPLIADSKNHIVHAIDDIRDQQAMLTLHANIMAGGRVNLKKEITQIDRDETNQLVDDPTKLVFDMKTTLQNIKKGNVSVRSILTGWCDKLGTCHSNLMLMFTDCKECDHAHHELDRIEANLNILERYIKERLAKGKDENDLEVLDAKKKITYLNRVKANKQKDTSNV